MFQTHPPLEERLAANRSFLSQHPHASDKEDEVTQAAAPAQPRVIDLSIPYQPFADLPKSNLFSDFGNLRVGTPTNDSLRGH